MANAPSIGSVVDIRVLTLTKAKSVIEKNGLTYSKAVSHWLLKQVTFRHTLLGRIPFRNQNEWFLVVG